MRKMRVTVTMNKVELQNIFKYIFIFMLINFKNLHELEKYLWGENYIIYSLKKTAQNNSKII